MSNPERPCTLSQPWNSLRNPATSMALATAVALAEMLVFGLVYFGNSQSARWVLETGCTIGREGFTSDHWTCSQLAQAAVAPFYLFDAMAILAVAGLTWVVIYSAGRRQLLQAAAKPWFVVAVVTLILGFSSVIVSTVYLLGLYSGWPICLALRDWVAGLLY